MNKKIALLALLAFAAPFWMQAQTAYDALRFSQVFYTGTARSAAMGNAMTALGGDFGALSINPAGSAVYPYSEFVCTPLLHTSLTKADYLSNTTQEARTRLGISNVGYVSAYHTPNFSLSFGVGYNALNNFTDRFSAGGTTNQSSWLASLAYNTDNIQAKNMDWNKDQNPFYQGIAPWRSILAWNVSLLDTIPGSGGLQYIGATEAYFGNHIGIPGNLRQNYVRQANGNTGEYLINVGLNLSNKLFLGANIGFQSIWYDYSESYSEEAVKTHEFSQTAFKDFTHSYTQTTSGIGLNLKLGVIFLPVDNFRLGASISTPTWMRLHDEWQETIKTSFSDGYRQNLESPLGTYDYHINTPFRWNVGMAYTFGAFGAVSVDYEQTAYNRIMMNATDYRTTNPFADELAIIKKEFRSAGNLRTGLEINLSEAFALRGGYAYYQNPEKSNGFDTHIASLGVGLQAGSFFSDLTFMQRFAQKEGFALYGDVYDGNYPVYSAPVGTQTVSNWKVLLSFGFRF